MAKSYLEIVETARSKMKGVPKPSPVVPASPFIGKPASR